MLDPSDISDYSFGHEQKYHDRRRAACLDRRLRHSAQLAADDLWETDAWGRSEEHTSELQSLMRISYAVFCLKKKKYYTIRHLSSYTVKETDKSYEVTQ